MVTTIRELRAKDPRLRFYAVSHLSGEDWAEVRGSFDWKLFHQVFPAHGMSGLRIYQHVLDETGSAADQAILVEGDSDNLVLARSLSLAVSSNTITLASTP